MLRRTSYRLPGRLLRLSTSGPACPRTTTLCDHVRELMNSTDVRTFFESAATEWDAMRLAYYDESVIETLADVAAVDPTHVVLDVGTGTGFVAAGLAQRSSHVIAIDNSRAMLDVAGDNLAQLGISNVELREADLERLPLDDDSVDAAVANMVIHHAVDPAAMLAEMTRVVRPGGRVAITDAVEHSYEWMRTEQADIWLGFTPEQVEGFFGSARLARYGYATLGSQ
jgi:ubiquinone/menaquinone biosynthesis C-methylase UbiE